MTRNGIYKMAAVNKNSALKDSAALLGTLAILGITIPSFAVGWTLGKTTAPRDTDMHNLQKEHRLARLQNDKRQLQLMRDQINNRDNDTQNKTVYGLV